MDDTVPSGEHPADVGAQAFILAQILSGSISVSLARSSVESIPDSASDLPFKTFLKMAISIMENKAMEVLQMAGSFLFPEVDRPQLNLLVECATVMLINEGYLTNEAPPARSHPVDQPRTTGRYFQRKRRLSRDSKSTLNELFAAVEGKVSDSDMEALALEHNVDLCTLKSFYKGWVFKQVYRAPKSATVPTSSQCSSFSGSSAAFH